MSTKTSLAQLPLDLGDGLSLRFAHCDDADQLSEFHHIADSQWVQAVKSDKHPMVKASDFTLVETIESRKIVSSMWLQSPTWSYRDTEFHCGEVYHVATHSNYRRRGLVRRQLDIFHAWSAAQRHLVQAISGIPWFYRQFGYEMAMNLDLGSRRIYPTHLPLLPKNETETFELRPPESEDFSFIQKLYEQNCQRQLFASRRSPAQWEFEFSLGAKRPEKRRQWLVIQDPTNERLGYLQYDIDQRYDANPEKMALMLHIHQLEIVDNLSYLNLMPSLLRGLWRYGQSTTAANPPQQESIQALNFKLGTDHPSYQTLSHDTDTRENYAWFIRVADLVAYLQHIKPALEQNLVGSVAQGYDGTFKVNLFRQGLHIKISKGKITEISPWMPQDIFTGNPRFPNLTFLHLVFGRRRFSALADEYPDVYADRHAAIVFDCLFPPFSGNIWKVV